MPIAGPVFPEWYWGPLFFLVAFSPLILGGAALLYAGARRIARRGGRRPRMRTRVLMAAASVLASIGLVVAGAATWRWIAFERANARAARALDFPAFLPLRAPDGYRETQARASASETYRRLSATYETGSRRLYLEQERAGPVDSTDPADCGIYVAGPAATHPASLGPCELRRSPGGRAALLVAGRPLASVYSVRDETLVTIRHPPGADADALALLDALEPVDPGNIDFKR